MCCMCAVFEGMLECDVNKHCVPNLSARNKEMTPSLLPTAPALYLAVTV